MPRSGTNSQGNSYTTPGGSNSNGGSSYHCKLKAAIAHQISKLQQMQSFRYLAAIVGNHLPWHVCVLYFMSIPLTSRCVCKTCITKTRTQTGPTTTQTTMDQPTTIVVREAAHTLRPNKIYPLRKKPTKSSQYTSTPNLFSFSIYNFNPAQRWRALYSSVGRKHVTKQQIL